MLKYFWDTFDFGGGEVKPPNLRLCIYLMFFTNCCVNNTVNIIVHNSKIPIYFMKILHQGCYLGGGRSMHLSNPRF